MAKLTMVEQMTTRHTAETHTMMLLRKYRKKSPVRTSLKLSRQKDAGSPHALPKYSFWVLKGCHDNEYEWIYSDNCYGQT